MNKTIDLGGILSSTGGTMLLNDSAIESLIDNKVIDNAQKKFIGSVVYDLSTEGFFIEQGHESSDYYLKPGDSVFVGSKEIIELPDDIAARVLLKNSRIRQGLHLDAPLYFPGHKTRVFFRITNFSSEEIRLDTSKGIAALAFEKLVESTNKPYRGAFSNEFDFRGMGDYASKYEADMKKLDKKVNDIKSIEKSMYTSVISLMAIFVGLFSLINVNLASAVTHHTPRFLLILNLVTIGSIAFLSGLIMLIVKPKGLAAKIVPWLASGAAFAVSVALIFRFTIL